MLKKLLLVLCIILVPLAGLSPPSNEEQKANEIFNAKKHLFYLTVWDKPFTPELLREAMYFEGIQSIEIAFKQAQLETGWFKSDLFVNANNLFGMRYARIRDTYAIGEYKHHAEYKTWISSVKDLALWQAWYIGKGYDLTNYFAFLLEIGYATDKKYLLKIMAMS